MRSLLQRWDLYDVSIACLCGVNEVFTRSPHSGRARTPMWSLLILSPHCLTSLLCSVLFRLLSDHLQVVLPCTWIASSQPQACKAFQHGFWGTFFAPLPPDTNLCLTNLSFSKFWFLPPDFIEFAKLCTMVGNCLLAGNQGDCGAHTMRVPPLRDPGLEWLVVLCLEIIVSHILSAGLTWYQLLQYSW